MMYKIKTKSTFDGDYFKDGVPTPWESSKTALLCDGVHYIVEEEWSVGTGTVSNGQYNEAYFDNLADAMKYYNEN